MNKRVIQKTVYVANDGREFDDEKQAIKHDNKLSVLRDLHQSIPLNVIPAYHAIYINENGFDPIVELIKEAFKLQNPDDLDVGWNLLNDRGDSARCQVIRALMDYIVPKDIPSKPIPQPEEPKGVSYLKLQIKNMLININKIQASPEAKLGELIMQLQDLIKE